jgi:hypothetical protein
VTCIDSDQTALDYVDTHVASATEELLQLRTLRYNALRTRSAARTVAKLGRFDIIYSAGLCDYLADEQLVGLLRGWRETLDQHGVLFVSFKDGNHYDKTPYQWHLDWHFLQRSQEDCLTLFESAGFDTGSLAMSRDETGIIMNFVYRRPVGPIIRIDLPTTDRKTDARPTARKADRKDRSRANGNHARDGR